MLLRTLTLFSFLITPSWSQAPGNAIVTQEDVDTILEAQRLIDMSFSVVAPDISEKHNQLEETQASILRLEKEEKEKTKRLATAKKFPLDHIEEHGKLLAYWIHATQGCASAPSVLFCKKIKDSMTYLMRKIHTEPLNLSKEDLSNTTLGDAKCRIFIDDVAGAAEQILSLAEVTAGPIVVTGLRPTSKIGVALSSLALADRAAVLQAFYSYSHDYPKDSAQLVSVLGQLVDGFKALGPIKQQSK